MFLFCVIFFFSITCNASMYDLLSFHSYLSVISSQGFVLSAKDKEIISGIIDKASQMSKYIEKNNVRGFDRWISACEKGGYGILHYIGMNTYHEFFRDNNFRVNVFLKKDRYLIEDQKLIAQAIQATEDVCGEIKKMLDKKNIIYGSDFPEDCISKIRLYLEGTFFGVINDSKTLSEDMLRKKYHALTDAGQRSEIAWREVLISELLKKIPECAHQTADRLLDTLHEKLQDAQKYHEQHLHVLRRVDQWMKLIWTALADKKKRVEWAKYGDRVSLLLDGEGESLLLSNDQEKLLHDIMKQITKVKEMIRGRSGEFQVWIDCHKKNDDCLLDKIVGAVEEGSGIRRYKAILLLNKENRYKDWPDTNLIKLTTQSFEDLNKFMKNYKE